MKRSFSMIEGYGPVYDTETELFRKSDTRMTKTCEVEKIWCPAPFDKKGCQIFKCEIPAEAGSHFKARDFQGERFFKVEQKSTVRWNGYTFTCAPE